MNADYEQRYREAMATIADLGVELGCAVELLRELRRPHLIVDGDCWFSCPLAVASDGESRCCNEDAVAGGVCTCGADTANGPLDAFLARFPDPTSEDQ